MPRLLQRQLNALSARRLTKSGRHADGSGLYLNVEATGTKSWILRVTVKGRARTIGLGSYLDVTLAEARDLATRLRKVAKSGGDPIIERDGDGDRVPTFEVAALKVFDQNKSAWRSKRHRDQWIDTLRDFAFPAIGRKRVDKIDSADILNVLQPIWLSKAETARRVKQRMRAVFDWCIAKHYRETMNPVDAVRMALPKQPSRRNNHHAALPYAELPAMLIDLRASRSNELVKIGLELLIHTASRAGEVRGIRWEEIDFETAVWTVPAGRMKSGESHRVPLTGRCLELLDYARTFETGSPYIVPGRNWKKPYANDAFPLALRRIGRTDITVHGFRSSFRDWAAECAKWPRDVCEAALAHQVRDQVEAAYKRTDFLEQRRPLMKEWSQFLTGRDC